MSDLEPKTWREVFLNGLSDSEQTLPEPVTREEMFLKKAIEAGGGGGGSSLPEVTSEDNGKVLTVVDGEWDKGKVEEGVVIWNNNPLPSGDEVKDVVLNHKRVFFTMNDGISLYFPISSYADKSVSFYSIDFMFFNNIRTGETRFARVKSSNGIVTLDSYTGFIKPS